MASGRHRRLNVWRRADACHVRRPKARRLMGLFRRISNRLLMEWRSSKRGRGSSRPPMFSAPTTPHNVARPWVAWQPANAAFQPLDERAVAVNTHWAHPVGSAIGPESPDRSARFEPAVSPIFQRQTLALRKRGRWGKPRGAAAAKSAPRWLWQDAPRRAPPPTIALRNPRYWRRFLWRPPIQPS